jgi:hypothetical protein
MDEPDTLILEGLVTTLDARGEPHVAPMGPRVDRHISRLVLRPFQTSATFQNLNRDREGVFHVTDDVELIAQAAVGQLTEQPPLVPVPGVRAPRLADCCRWFALRVIALDDATERTTIECDVVARGTVRDYFGLNRAKHAVLEAAILATRIGILPPQQIADEMARLAIPVEKTAGQSERRAFEFLRQFVAQRLAVPPS